MVFLTLRVALHFYRMTMRSGTSDQSFQRFYVIHPQVAHTLMWPSSKTDPKLTNIRLGFLNNGFVIKSKIIY
jgi:hypothetical protein